MTASAPLRAAIYLRMSLDRELGIDRQREDCSALCERLGWTGVEYVDNDKSATKASVIRHDYERMCKDIEGGEIDAIITWRSDRLYRTLRDLLPFIDLIMAEQKGGRRIPIETCQTGLIDLTTDSGRMTAKILAAVSENEGEVRTARQRRALEQIAASGRGWGVRAFGYNGDHHNPKQVPKEAAAIKQGYTDLLAGDSLYSIARAWNDAGLKTPATGKIKRKNAGMWNSTSVRRQLTNPRNAGLRSFRGNVVGLGDWPAIVPVDTWENACYLLSDPRRRNGHTYVRKQLLGGILRCGGCGDGLRSAYVRGAGIYRCPNRTGTCTGGVGRRREIMDAWVRKQVVAKLAQADWMTGAIVDQEDAHALHEEAVQIRLRMDSLANDFAEGDLNASQLRVATEKLQGKLAGIENRLARAAKSRVYDGLVGVKDLQVAYDALPIDRERALILSMIDKIVVNQLSAIGRPKKSVPVGTGIKIHWHQPDHA